MKKQITLDKFKIICAILIIAIHTYPFLSINENLDFIFTHVFCRIGVPFFLMVTGFFVLPKALDNRKALIKYTVKIIKIYAICILLYLPINIYAGKFSGIGATGILKELFISGTFYHLWYFPALILGIWITYFLIKHLKGNIAIFICTILYIIGLFGDSYYGIAQKSDILRNIYNIIFNIFDYTRNGLFYVPIFIILGYNMKHIKLNLSKSTNIVFIFISLILMICEGAILHYFDLQKWDSMYIMLIPTMILIFNLIMQNNNENNKHLRNISTVIYIVHPISIIVVRGVAKVLKLQEIMINNSIVHYLLVVIITVLFSIVFEKIKEKRSSNLVCALEGKDNKNGYKKR